MHITLLVLVFSMLSFQSFGQSLRMNNADDPEITYGSTLANISPVRSSSGDGSIFSSRFKTFVAVSSDNTVTVDPGSGAANQDSGVFHIESASNLPQANNTGVMTSGVLDVRILYNTSGTTKYITALVSPTESSTTSSTEPTDWTYYRPTTTSGFSIGSVSKNTDTAITVRFNLDEICTNTYLGCGTFNGSLRTTRQIYLYLDDFDQTSGNAAGTPSNNQNGIYLELNISDNPPNGTNTIPTISSIDRGDGALTINYVDGTSAINDLEELRVCTGTSAFTGSSASTEITIDNAAGAGSCNITDQIFDAGTEGSIAISDLANGQTTFVAISLVDSYRFSTALSGVKSGTPLSIETLLETNQCFIATAVYGRDDKVIRYLRAFRDRVLMQNDLGRKFVDLYYEYSPPIAKIILDMPILREIVRPIVYLFYLMIKYWWGCLILVLIFSISIKVLISDSKERLSRGPS